MRKYLFLFLATLFISNIYADDRIRGEIRDVLSDYRYEMKVEKKERKKEDKKNENASPNNIFRKSVERERHKSTASGSFFDLFPVGLSKFLFYLLGIMCVAIVFGLILFHIMNSMGGGQDSDVPLEKSGDQTQKDLEELEKLDNFKNMTAEQLLEEGRIADACLKVFHEAVVHLIKNKLIKFRIFYTPRDILQKTKDKGDLKSHLRKIVSIIEKGQYAKVPLDIEDYKVCQSSLQALMMTPAAVK